MATVDKFTEIFAFFLSVELQTTMTNVQTISRAGPLSSLNEHLTSRNEGQLQTTNTTAVAHSH